MNKPNSFSKSEHLCGEKRIARLFTHGDAFIAYPLRVIYLLEQKNENESVRVMVNVPKKRFKRAVKRNRLKRLMRETYRLNKQLLVDIIEAKNIQINIAFNYISDEEMDFKTIEKKMKIALQKLIEKIEQT